jgi:hypothetical protein
MKVFDDGMIIINKFDELFTVEWLFIKPDYLWDKLN